MPSTKAPEPIEGGELEWDSAEGRESYIADFVTRMWERDEAETIVDRNRWTLAFNLFQGKQDWGDERDEQEWMSRPFLHEFSKIVRRISEVMSGLVFERDDFFQLESNDPEDIGNTELARIFEKVVRYDLKQLNIESLFTDFTTAAGTSGLGIFKLWVEPKLVWGGEIVVEEVEEQEASERKKIAGKIENPSKLPDNPEDLESVILAELDDTLGGSSPKLRRVMKPKKRHEMQIAASIVDPRNFAFEPDIDRIQNSPHFIERIYKRFYQLESSFETGFLDPSKREKLANAGNISTGTLGASVTSYETIKSGTRDQVDTRNEFTPVTELYEYFGPLLGKDGRIIEENRHFIVGNRTIVLRDKQNSTYAQEAPYITTVFSKSPFKAVGQGVADNGIDQQLLINDLFATFLDMFKLAVYAPLVIDDTALKDPEEIEGGMYPGMIIKTFGKPADDVFSTIPYNLAPGQLIFQVLNQLRVSASSAAGVDVSNSNPSARSRISATEVQENSQRGDESVMALGRELDASFVEPLIKKLVDYRLQFGFEADALEDLRLKGVLSESDYQLVSGIPRIERYNEIKRSFKMKVKGFRERLERQVFLRNVNEFLGQAGNLPPDVLAKLQWENVLQDVTEAFGFDQDRWIAQNTPQDKAREENRLLQADQQVSNGEQDNDQLELPTHFEGLRQLPTQALVAHIQGHIQRILSRGEQLPQIPPDLTQILGLQQPAQQTNGAGPTAVQ